MTKNKFVKYLKSVKDMVKNEKEIKKEFYVDYVLVEGDEILICANVKKLIEFFEKEGIEYDIEEEILPDNEFAKKITIHAFGCSFYTME